MDARQHKRIIINLQAELIAEGMRQACFIENLSDKGIYIVTAPTKSALDFTPNTPFELKFQFPSGEKINLSCKVKWSYQTPPHGYTHSIGLEIIDPPLIYNEILKTLQ